MADLWIKRGDTLPRAETTLVDGEGVAVDIAEALVAFTLREIDGDVVIDHVEASNDQVGDGSDGSRGRAHYQWVPGDTDVPGGYDAEWEVTFVSADEAVMTFPNDGYNSVAILTDLEAIGS